MRINHLLTEFKKHVLMYRDGFFDLSYLFNSPAIMVESLKRMPFIKYFSAEKEIHTDNTFAEGVMRYQELEDGLWIIITEVEFKKNVSISALYDQEPCDYYLLSHFIYTSPIRGIELNDITTPTVGWSLYKPGTQIKAYFHKGDKGVFANFVFNELWFERNMPLNAFLENHNFRQFLESDLEHIALGNVLCESEQIIKEILDLMKHRKQTQPGIIAIKIRSLQVISNFFTDITTKHPGNVQIKLQVADSRLVASIEKILIDNLTISFPGIEAIALTLHTSPTKLRTIFKAVHNNSIFQYYQEKQMLLALEMLKANPTSIKAIALTFGYQNPSKFSAAFKKHHNILPSEVYYADT